MKWLLLVVALAATACRAASEPEPATRDVVVWREVGSWSGKGSAQTGSFSSETGSLRVRWETKGEREPGAGTFEVTLHSAVSGRPLLPAVDHKGEGRDVVYLHEDPRVFYFEVVSANLDWSMTVEEGIPATVLVPAETTEASPPAEMAGPPAQISPAGATGSAQHR